jgi:tetratricopeptide (TPR) repeat protein
MAPSSHFQRGVEQLKAGNYAEARKLFAESEAAAGTVEKTKADLAQAEAKLAAGDVGGAAALYEAVLDRNPGLPEVYLGLARIGLFTGKAEDARTHARAATQLAPTLPLAWTLFGLAHEAAGDLEVGLTHLRKGAELGPDSFLCQFNLGRALTSVGRGADALPALARAAELDPRSPDVQSVLGFAYRQVKQYENAIKAFERAKDLAPKSLDAYATLADVLFEVQEFKAARIILDQGLKACGDHPALLEKALSCSLMLGDANSGIDYVERELKLVPDHEQGWLNLAGLYLLTKDFTRSEAVAKTLLQKNPKRWEAWLHLGDLYDAVPNEAEAEKAYRKALELAPGEWKAYANFGSLLVQSTDAKKYPEAKKLLEQAVSLAPPGELRPLYNLALAHVRLGDKARAKALAKEIQGKAPPDSVMHAEARKLEVNLAG